ncbi:unnamed protein product [Rotaria sp. Silwood1]|nr:unnamed protein product [Rotaria sp. Silwood1]
MLHYLHLLLDIQNCKKIYSFSINCKQITFFYVEKESKSNLYNYYKSQDLDMFNNYSETSLPVDMIITKEEWKNKYLNEVIWKIFTNFLTMSNNFYEYATLNIDPRDDLFDCRYMIRKKLGIGLTTMVYLLEKKEDNYLIEDSPHYAMKILKENDYSEYFLNEIKITEKLTQFDNSNKFYLFFQDILSPLSSGKYLVYEKELQCIDSLALIQSKQFIDITHYLYDCHIIHCDVRPKNLMLDRDTNHIKLIDFGFAIAYDEDDDRSTVDIMDPVMYANDKFLDFQLELLTGKGFPYYHYEQTFDLTCTLNIIMSNSNADMKRNIQSINILPDVQKRQLESLKFWQNLKQTNKHYSKLLNLMKQLDESNQSSSFAVLKDEIEKLFNN